ncbi:MAG: acetylglutamate kinase [bacterium]
MINYIEKTEILLQALPYIQSYRDKIVVIKLGGSIMDNIAKLKSVLRDIVFMDNVGMRIVLVHGGGKKISAAMKKAGIRPEFIGGLRVTGKDTIKIVEKVLGNTVNNSLVKSLEKLGAKAVGFSAADNGVIQVVREFGYEQEERKGISGSRSLKKKIDIGYVGKITRVFTRPIYRLLNTETIPVIAPLGLGPHGFVHNVNADVAACEIARYLKAEKLVFITDVDGIYAQPEKSEEILSTLKAGAIKSLIRKNIIKGGMIPKSHSMTKAIRAGVKKVHIINGNMPHALLLEIFTDSGVGTQIIK